MIQLVAPSLLQGWPARRYAGDRTEQHCFQRDPQKRLSQTGAKRFSDSLTCGHRQQTALMRRLRAAQKAAHLVRSSKLPRLLSQHCVDAGHGPVLPTGHSAMHAVEPGRSHVSCKRKKALGFLVCLTPGCAAPHQYGDHHSTQHRLFLMAPCVRILHQVYSVPPGYRRRITSPAYGRAALPQPGYTAAGGVDEARRLAMGVAGRKRMCLRRLREQQ